ncbi:MAG TPA: SDR family oxidoreductase [Candidatus Dormibacteraeota bacterium]
MTRHLVTGATGFIGGALVLELLAATGDDVVCLVRAPDAETAGARLRAGLEAAAEAYGRPAAAAVRERCVAVPGDVGAVDAVDLAATGRCRTVWHAAASLRYLQRDAKEILATNVDGTRQVLDLAARVGAETFHHVSTAYVAGRRTGLVREEPVAGDTPVHNLYERSKIEAEALVLADDRMRTRVLRPSIVIGHGETYATFSSTGLYGAFVQFEVFRERVRERLGAYLTHYRAQIAADPASELNAIPVDIVARNAVRIGLSDSPARIFHLTNSRGPTVEDGAVAAFTALGMNAPELVPSKATFSALDRALDRGIDFFASYMKSSRTFDRTNAEAVCGEGAFAYPLDRALLERFGNWFLEHVERTPSRARRTA